MAHGMNFGVCLLKMLFYAHFWKQLFLEQKKFVICFGFTVVFALDISFRDVLHIDRGFKEARRCDLREIMKYTPNWT